MNRAQIVETPVIVPAWTARPESLGMFQGRHRLDKVFWIVFHGVHEL
jgi:hypothetical protein